MTISELTRDTRARLAPRFGDTEAQWMVREMMEQVFARSRTDLLIDADKEAAPVRVELIGRMTSRLLAGEPLQYILGFETFMGMRIDVSPAVLIPRPETEELVELILDSEGSAEDLRVADFGTGSGCIAIALARNLRFPQVTAIDVSPDALAVAEANARRLKAANVRFVKADMLQMPVPEPGTLDVVVSNPPYVMESEKASMEPNVLNHEPPGALFVPDSDPLRFYTAVAAYAMRALAPGGRIYFELNPLTAERLARQMRADGWTDVDVTLDSRGYKRFLRAVSPRAI